MGKIGFQELLLILGVALLIFGPAKLPEIGKAFGKTVSEFRNAAKEVTDSLDDTIKMDAKKED